MNRCLILLVSALLVPLGSGCATTTQIKAGAHDQFRNALVESCSAANDGDLVTAQAHLDVARGLAKNAKHAAKVDDLQRVIGGAAAMNAGRPQEAARSWLAIQDRRLRKQMVSMASQEGLDLQTLADDAGGS